MLTSCTIDVKKCGKVGHALTLLLSFGGVTQPFILGKYGMCP